MLGLFIFVAAVLLQCVWQLSHKAAFCRIYKKEFGWGGRLGRYPANQREIAEFLNATKLTKTPGLIPPSASAI